MTTLTPDRLQRRKQAIRVAAHAARNAQADRDVVSQRITDVVMSLPEYQHAKRVMWYIDVRGEVRTQHAFPVALASDKAVVIPYCVEGELGLFHLESMDELAPGRYGILEPKQELRDITGKHIGVEQVDLILVPGVAFDSRGGRIGHGQGYYDKLLAKTRPDTSLVALAFQCQIVAEIPVLPHDISMDKVVTQTHVYTGQGRTPS
ncbi:5-formyltetrahydrofolate cyclo-ligase [Allorhodopirellula solitaria]|uniref:5-formyltetrahydrofolate cyclo-ligase n=1 Tax=Allorhodopirellula solitaria TaxID=2527987 RepID=A0A5C5X384_9BACT|nr:5-formyltetrahydrofolate cyclo-ligase [Allorhodopirellula solitaria]TWT56642.1 5-formyltetrahydrofolate cyclo-ligase family protein [Allorhodopirellula solitaria]